MTEAPLRWGILSTARINRALIPALQRSPGNELVAVASRDGERAGAYAERFGIPRSYAGYEALLAADDIDVIYNPLPNHLHAPYTIAASETGKHVLCEKPLALTVEDVDAVAEAASRHSVVVAEAFMYRHHPQTQRIVELVRAGVIGSLQTLRGSFTFPLERAGDVRHDPAMGGGSLWDIGCYPVSFARTMVGETPAEVAGWARLGPTGVDLTFWGTIRFPGGAVAQFDSGFASPFRAQMEIVGSDGMIVVPHPFRPDDDETFLLGTAIDRLEPVHVTGGDLYRGEVEDLAEAARTGRPPRVSLADTRENVATVVALARSAADGGRPVAL